MTSLQMKTWKTVLGDARQRVSCRWSRCREVLNFSRRQKDRQSFKRSRRVRDSIRNSFRSSHRQRTPSPRKARRQTQLGQGQNVLDEGHVKNVSHGSPTQEKKHECPSEDALYSPTGSKQGQTDSNRSPSQGPYPHELRGGAQIKGHLQGQNSQCKDVYQRSQGRQPSTPDGHKPLTLTESHEGQCVRQRQLTQNLALSAGAGTLSTGTLYPGTLSTGTGALSTGAATGALPAGTGAVDRSPRDKRKHQLTLQQQKQQQSQLQRLQNVIQPAIGEYLTVM